MHGGQSSPRRGVVERVLAISARRVAPGGDRGWWQWLVPALLVSVVALAVVHMNAVGSRASAAPDDAASAQKIASAANEAKALGADRPLGRDTEASVSDALEAAALQMQDAAVNLSDKQSGDPEASLLAGRSMAAAAAIRRFLSQFIDCRWSKWASGFLRR